MLTLREMLNEDTVRLQTFASDWEEAIRLGGGLLVDIGAAEARYVDAMVRFKNELGPYIVLAPGLALPHARPEEGVIKTHFSLVTLKEPVEFGNKDNDPVYVLFTMAARDQDEHIEALRQIANLCDDEDIFEQIRTAETLQDIHTILDEAGDLLR